MVRLQAEPSGSEQTRAQSHDGVDTCWVCESRPWLGHYAAFTERGGWEVTGQLGGQMEERNCKANTQALEPLAPIPVSAHSSKTSVSSFLE